jgi:hypothetical protein
MCIAGHVRYHPTKEPGTTYVSAKLNELSDDQQCAITASQVLALDLEECSPKPKFCEAIGSLVHAAFCYGPFLLEILDRSGAIVDTLDNERRRRAHQAEREHYASLIHGLNDLGYKIVQ